MKKESFLAQKYAGFPSPRPSPHGRGRIAFQSSANPRLLFISRAGLRVSLSLGERAGVRGKGVH